ncbi:MAG: hypothetical protein V1710_10345, partial [Candidatus Bathyarchaeota archaeon]
MGSEPRQVQFLKVELDLSPYEVFSRLQEGNEYAFLLESIEGPKKLVEYSFIGVNPKYVFISADGGSTVRDRDGQETVFPSGLPLRLLRTVTKSYEVDDHGPRYIGGSVGYLSYDVVRHWEEIPCDSRDDYGFPDVEMGVYLDGLIFDHMKGETYYHYIGEDRFHVIA